MVRDGLILVRLIGLAGQWWVSSGDAEWRRAIRPWVALSFAGLATVAVAAALPSGPRTVAFGVAAALDLFSAWRAGDGEWRLYPEHFAERHGLFVIIALGESLIAAGTFAADQPRTGVLLAAVIFAVAGACALWWTYFAGAKGALEETMHRTASRERGSYARDVYSLLHFPIIGGVVGFAVAIEEAVAHPTEHLEPAGALALVVGVALFVGCTGVALLRARAGWPVVRALGVAALLGSYPLAVAWSAPSALAWVAAIVVVVAAAEALVAQR